MTNTVETDRWLRVTEALLIHHFGISLNDTGLGDITVLQLLITAGIRPYEAINDLIDKYDLVHLNDVGLCPRALYLDAADELMAGLATGISVTVLATPGGL